MNVSKPLQLHIIILFWGFTPVLGKLISLNSYDLVWWRLVIAGLALLIYMRFKKVNLKTDLFSLAEIMVLGLMVGLHWFFFYHAIKVSNVSMTMAGFSTITLFASLLQPILLKKKFFWGDLIYGIVIAAGLTIILQFEQFYAWGVFYGIMAALTGAVFGTYNAKMVTKHEASKITLIEFLTALVFITIMKLVVQSPGEFFPAISLSDLIYLCILGIVCTTVAFTWSIEILKHFTPFYVIVTNNLEPVYGILFSIILFGESEMMSPGFYGGALIILMSVFSYPFIQKKYIRS